jgi:hypothetical protein
MFMSFSQPVRFGAGFECWSPQKESARDTRLL